MDVVIIGTGNTATILGRKLKDAGHNILQIYGRDASAASDLAYILDTESTNYTSIINKEADIYIIAVSDDAISSLISELRFGKKIVVHTAASVSKNVLKPAAEHYGVFYPVQSLKQESANLPDTPIIIDASDAGTFTLLKSLAYSITEKVVEADDEKRLKLHLAAVFCNNFTNHVYALIEEYCNSEKLDFNMLIPLIKETGQRLSDLSPGKAQTGPAVRNDEDTISKHLELLINYPELSKIYRMFSHSIAQHHSRV